MKSVFVLIRVLAYLCVLMCILAMSAFGSDVYIAQYSTGSDNGAGCSNAHSAMWFNTLGNWGTGTGNIGPDSNVHLCGTFTGTVNTTMLTFQGSGTIGHPITILFESGAKLESPRWAETGAINLNNKNYILIDGGTTCGQIGGVKTECNGLIRNTLSGSAGLTCPGGTCAITLDGGSSSGIFSEGSSSGIEIKNLHIGPMYVRELNTNAEGMSTAGVAIIHGSSQNISFHNNIIEGAGHLLEIGWSDSATGTLSGFYVYNNNLSNMCWAIGMGKGGSGIANDSGLIGDIQIYNNEMYDWRWAGDNFGANVCHANGTMLFNGDGYTLYSVGYIGDNNSNIYNNYLHGSLTGGIPETSPSGWISCQDSCGPINVFNNVVIDNQATGANGGGLIYFNGIGGGGQKVYNNTLVRPHNMGACITVTADSRFGNVLIKNNIMSGCSAAIEMRTNNPTRVTSDYNDGYDIGTWFVYNSAVYGNFVSLSSFRSTYGQELHSITTNPNLTTTYELSSTSPARDTGTALGSAYALDKKRVSRPQGAAWDIGAYEYILRKPLPPRNVKVTP